VIQSSGLDARHPMKNKQWPVERFQAVVDALAGEFDFVQIGSAADPPLKDVENLSGKTTIRQSASILHNAR
jgi:ADP-heptose:LPS heptosyltransferase